MPASSSRRRLLSNFTLGGEQAEQDPILQQAFYESDDYLSLESRHDTRCFLIGRTGSGKSAALQRLEEEHAEHIIRISPEDLSLPYITDMGVVRHLDDLDVNLDLLFVALWKHVLLVELFKHRYSIDSPDAKARFLANLRDRIKRDSGKRAALDYLDEFGESFWAETDERVREITEKFERQIKASDKANIGVSGIGKADLEATQGETHSRESRVELARRYQRIVNETQLARLNKMIKVLNEDVLNTPQHFTYVIIDDLDREWVDERLANSLIRCLFSTVLELGRVKHLKVIVALRTNIFEQLDFGQRLGGQEEKFRAMILQMRWTRVQLREMLNLRLAVAYPHDDSQVREIHDLLPKINQRRGDPLEYMIDRTLMRPRDLLTFINKCFTYAGGKDALSWDDIHGAERDYSVNRLFALRDEWKSSYRDLERVLNVFNGAELPMTKDQFSSRLNDVALLLADRDFEGREWLDQMTAAMWNADTGEDWNKWYQPLIAFLYNIGFIGCAANEVATPIYSYDSPGFADRASNLNGAKYFTIHPTYQVGLDVKSGLGRHWS